MDKTFNITGVCNPRRHYMVDLTQKLDQVFVMIQNEKYFTINRPHQYGKTTLLFLLTKKLKATKEYFPISISLEGISEHRYASDRLFIEAFLTKLKLEFELKNPELVKFIQEKENQLNYLDELDLFFTQLIRKIGKQVILIIDEVDRGGTIPFFSVSLVFFEVNIYDKWKTGT